ncbi:SAM-dependent methyltransferase [Actinophytocola glycyrrhizae]|uniref:S-adenosyl-L-methionine-dependent methyltransferase n=1 Tax=Actinophytocola glycyrrhizae TaxID=2044873 RepID=A0ABV9S6J4_9PSEU
MVGSGVGLTALMVAAARAIETHRPDSLAQDEYAEHFVRAAPASSDWPVRPQDVADGDANPLWGRLGRYFGLRTRVIDDVVLEAGNRQTVLLGAGLDTRAFRLPWVTGSAVYELDQPSVLAFKQRVLDGLGATARTERHSIPTDLRHDWAGLLPGFRPTEPTTWLAEGLLLYLPSDAERNLVETVDRLAAPGSTFVYEVKLFREPAEVRDSPVYRATKAQIGVDLIALFDRDPRPDSAAHLGSLGWTTTTHLPYDFTRRHGRGPLPLPDDALNANRWVIATKR